MRRSKRTEQKKERRGGGRGAANKSARGRGGEREQGGSTTKSSKQEREIGPTKKDRIHLRLRILHAVRDLELWPRRDSGLLPRGLGLHRLRARSGGGGSSSGGGGKGGGSDALRGIVLDLDVERARQRRLGDLWRGWLGLLRVRGRRVNKGRKDGWGSGLHIDGKHDADDGRAYDGCAVDADDGELQDHVLDLAGLESGGCKKKE
ncbi:hypothetical protein C8R44DRAFT_862718 [Mycena epipterygia]|nr:hypothetical protein C8R44DRAFT_862718 [Mycena epipterygia]